MQNANYQCQATKNYNWHELFLPCLFFVFNIILIVVCNLVLGLKPFATYCFIDIAFLLIVSATIYIIPNFTIKMIVSYFFVAITTIICIVNACLFQVFGDIFYVQMLFLMEEAVTSFDISYLNIPVILLYLALVCGYSFLVVKYAKYLKTNNMKNSCLPFKKTFAIFLVAGIMAISMFGFSKYQITYAETTNAQTTFSDSELYSNMNFKYSGLSKFGFWGFYGKEIINLIFKSNLSIDEETNEKFKNLNNFDYFDTNAKNFGLLSEDNLICILTESLEWPAIDPYLTPFLYDLYNNKSVCLTNYHAKNKTNMSENIIMYGMTPSSYSLSPTPKEDDLCLPYSLANMLKEKNYSTSYFHPYLNYFYERNKIFPCIGFENLTFVDDVNLGYKNTTLNDSASDYDFYNSVKDNFIKTNGKFYTQYATISTHGFYTNKKQHLADIYPVFNNENLNFINWKNYLKTTYGYELNEKTKEGNLVINYKAGAIDLDRTIKAIFDDLEKNNLLNNTTVVLFADHNAFVNNLGNILKGIDNSKIYSPEEFWLPACIYNSKLPPQKISAFTNTYDLHRTIDILLGLNSNIIIDHGYNIFDEEEISNSFFMSFSNGSFDEYHYSKDYTNIYKIDGTLETDENKKIDFLTKVNEFFNKQIFIDKILYNNMFNNNYN